MSTSNDKWYLDYKEPKLPTMRMWIFQQMSLGAAYAGAVFFGAIVFVLILVAFSKLLPEDPFAALETGKAVLTALT